MRKLFTAFTLIVCALGMYAQKNYDAFFNQKSSDVYEITFDVRDFALDEVTIDGNTFTKIDMGVSTVNNQKGWAELPFISASIALPSQKDVDLNIVYTDFVDIPVQHPMLPSRGTIYRNQDPSQIPYEIAPESIIDEFYPTQNVSMDDPFIFREVRGTTVRVFPFQYNAASGTLRFYKTVRVELAENNNIPTNPFLRERSSYIKEAEAIYSDIFLNYSSPKAAATLSSGDYGDILLITTSTYSSTMDTYIQWKKEMGYNVKKTIVATGTNVASTIATEYATNPNLMYVQLAGDWADIKSPTINVTTSADPCDPFMGAVSGSDNYIDISVGRFSCSSTANLLVQINKAITYEKTPDMTAGWRETFIGIASDEGSGSGDDGEIDYTHVQRIYTYRLDPFTYNTHQQNYAPSASASTLAGHINSGASTIAYCGHGSETSFVTTGFSNTNVNSLTNGNKLPFIVSVACVNGTFHYASDCFAEAWLRKSGGGAVVTWMATINQPWTPPQRGQDYFYDILKGGFNYDTDGISATAGYNTSEQRTHWGSIVVNAAVLMLTQSSTTDDIETIKTWTTFGDASLQLRTKIPASLVLSNTTPAVGEPFAGTATVDGSPAANVLICISANDTYYSALTNASGQYSITHGLTAGNALLVATAFNSTTIYQTVTVTDSDPCFPVSDISATTAGNSATITWTAPTEGNVTGYKVYRGGVLQTTVTGLSYTQNSLANGYYEYCVAAVFDGTECFAQECVDVFINDGSNNDCESPTALAIDEVDPSTHNLSWSEPAGSNVIFDDIESHTAFTINSAGSVPWTYIDGDATTTYSISNYGFTNQSLAMAAIVFDPTQVLHTTNSTPLTETTDGTPFTAHSGDQFFACFNSASVQTNDWIISPELSFTAPFEFSFYARSGHKTAYPEAFKVAYSTTTNTQAAFTNVLATISSAPFAWTEYSYTVPANAKYVAINCNSNDMYYFCIDDIYIGDGSMPGAALTGYNVYCDGVLLGTTTETNFTNADASAGYHEYCVEAVYADNCVSPQVCETIGASAVTYSITANAGANGSVTPSGTTTVNEGSNQTYTITPATCYQISNVLVDGVSVGAVSSYTFTNVTANHTISATFSQLSYTVSVSDNGHGTHSGIASTVICGSTHLVTIAPDACWAVGTVTVNGTPVSVSGNSFTVSNVSSNLTIVITYVQISYTITSNAGTGGTIAGAGTSALCGSNVTFTVNPSSCYEINTVTVNGTPVTLSGGSYTIENVTSNQTIAATFTQIQYNVSISNGSNGLATANSTVNCSGDLVITINPDECYELSALTVNGTPVSVTGDTYTVENVTEDLAITSTFVEDEITITATAGTGGTITPSGEVSISCGGNRLFTITPDENYIILAVYVNGISQGAPTSYMFTNLTEDASIEAQFQYSTDISGNEIDEEIGLYPNPASEYFELIVRDLDMFEMVQICSVDGKIVSETRIFGNKTIVNISSLAQGTYFVRVSGNANSQVIKLNKF